MSDIRVENHGSVFGLSPLTTKGLEWLQESTEHEAWMWMGHTLFVEHRYAPEIVKGAIEDGLQVE